jgi:hypothetical protein
MTQTTMPAAIDKKTAEEEDAQDPRCPRPSLTQQYPSSSMIMHVYPPTQHQPPIIRSKRRQVKNACTNCRKACKKCDDARPCLRCVKYDISDSCVDSPRKPRTRGLKRGPYKRNAKGVFDRTGLLSLICGSNSL